MSESILRPVRRLLIKLQKELKAEERNKIEEVERYRRSMEIVMTHIKELNGLVAKMGFRDDLEEIEYFRVFMPGFHSRYFYYYNFLELEEEIVLMEEDEKRKYLRGELGKQEKIKLKNSQKYKDLKSATNGVAASHYLRSKDTRAIPHSHSMTFCKSECTNSSILLSKLIANNMVILTLQKKIKKLR